MSSLTDEVKGLFEPRSKLLELRKEAARILNNDEWSAYKKASSDFDRERRYTRRTFELEYADRVSDAQRSLIQKAGSVKRRLVDRRFGSDPFNRQHINRQAQLEVRSAHKKDMARIDDRECNALNTMLDSAKVRVKAREKPIKDFQKAVDRRSGEDRRVRSWNR
ncbi:hypothetical protein [Thalassovita sp.]|uniref:hypothetical protein n=1 Tax=Thalassovita sp. TaxID=1979401 RepID=UPI0028819AC9|nr:hypothetical protein [Thalassovita sp.]MDF1803189.1 hypothetical protein [Thalassovita sp.]